MTLRLPGALGLADSTRVGVGAVTLKAMKCVCVREFVRAHVHRCEVCVWFSSPPSQENKHFSATVLQGDPALVFGHAPELLHSRSKAEPGRHEATCLGR